MNAATAPCLHPVYIKTEQLGAEITELCGYLNSGTCRLLTLIREFDAEDLWGHEGTMSCAHWLNWKCGLGMNAAREKVRVARALGGLPKIEAAFASGEISYSKVRAMTRVADSANEGYLLMIAHHGTASHVESLIAKYRRSQRLEEAENAKQQYAHRALRFFHDDDGSMILEGRLPPETGALILKALDKAVEDSDSDVSAETSTTSDTSTKDRVSAEPRVPLSTQRCDALAELAETYLASGPVTGSSADRYQVMVHVSAETLIDGSGERCELEEGPEVSAETSRRLACDGSVVKIFEDEDGEPLNIGRKTRSIPTAMRRALKTRDRGCRFPGCHRSRKTHGHHIKHWAEGGETSLDNLVQLCHFHHRLVHEGGFGCHKNPDKTLQFTDPRGEGIDEHYVMPPIDEPDYPIAWLNEALEDNAINAETCVTQWDGTVMDYDLGTSALWALAVKKCAES